jgi:hypothetical protein
VPLRATTAVLLLDELLLMVICPLAAPADAGLYCTCSVIDCAGLSVAGKPPPMIVKPAPLIAAEFTVTEDVPVDVSVNDCVVAVFTVTLPKFRLDALTVNCAALCEDPCPCIGTCATVSPSTPISVTCPE